jgi:hypothetical protein
LVQRFCRSGKCKSDRQQATRKAHLSFQLRWAKIHDYCYHHNNIQTFFHQILFFPNTDSCHECCSYQYITMKIIFFIISCTNKINNDQSTWHNHILLI